MAAVNSNRASTLWGALGASGLVGCLVLLSSALPASAWPTPGRRPPTMRGLRLSPEEWDFLPVEAGARQFRVMAFDGHVHSAFSRDAVHPIEELVWLVERRDLDLLVLTDHGASAGRDYLEREYRGPVHALIGEEVGGSFGHAVIWDIRAHRGISEASGDSMEALGTLVHGQGGTVVLAHPGWWIGRNTWDPRRWMQYDALRRGGIGQQIDALELWNQVYWQRSRELIDEWVGLLERGLYVPIVGNSDFHRADSHRLGEPRNAMLCVANRERQITQSARDCLREAVRSGRLYVTDGPSIDLQVAGRVPGEVVEAIAGTLLAGELRARSAEGGTLELFVGRDLRARVPLAPGVTVSHRFTVPVPAADSFVRVEIQRSSVPEDRPAFSLLTNPVRIDVLPRRGDGWRGPDEGPVPGPSGFHRDEVSPRERARAQRRVDLRGAP
ncbi:MAG: CehA/McbA family metallohydrolase [Deltaproteobacteria bacterium]|jgi:hypothetical protein